MRKNLKNEISFDRNFLDDLMKNLIHQASENNAYQLSMPLMASALLGNEKLYFEILPRMQVALNALTENEASRKAWLLGRILFSADSIGDHLTANQAKLELRKMLESTMENNEFTAWALGYIAGSGNEEYHDFKKNMLDSAIKLTQLYNTEKIGSPKINDLATNAMWAWIMALQAVAVFEDKIFYDFILEQMKLMMKKASIVEALNEGLRENDYPAWGFGIVYLAAATMEDELQCEALEAPLKKSIEFAKNTGKNSEVILALLNLNLAKTRLAYHHAHENLERDVSLDFSFGH